MADGSPIRFAYRFLPTAAILPWFALTAVPLGLGLYVWIKLGHWQDWPVPAVLLLISLCMIVRMGFLQSVILLVQGDSLIVIKRPFVRLFGSYDVFPRANIRHLRYRSEIHDRTGSRGCQYQDVHYILDLVTTDSQVLVLITSIDMPLARNLGKDLSRALDVSYEEYLADAPA